MDTIFSDLKVIDCASVIAAPTAAMMLGDFGADVIKIEQPGDGDMLRMLSHVPTTPEAGNDWFWQLDGRNKRGLCLDLKHPKGMAILHRLVAQCDVFITNHPASVRNSLGLNYEDLAPLNETMIYASLTAYGEQGPERERKGFDQLAYWARSGLMDLMRAPDTTPTQGLPGMGDHPTGVALYAAIVTALLHRERTGEGGRVHTSLLANGLWSAAGVAQGVLAGGDMTAYRDDNRTYSAMLRPYQASDGRWLQFNMIRNEELLSLLLAAMEAIELMADPRFGDMEALWTHRQAFGDELQSRIGNKTSDEWLEIFAAFDLPVNRVALVEDLLNDPQVSANAMAETPSDPSIEVPVLINHPINVDHLNKVGPVRAPSLGEHSKQILSELGVAEAEVDELLSDGVVVSTPPPS
ncbi:MAG: CaiB/BaiF CoA-transferase family protein [Pseudomonadota bacterium]|nr:CaiB/BaiF CoA-transferase family protein [Pseudomonadota bacterium]MED5346732.1 CaiB/BaiF CoA-transferase family protein [Pseudomonadota bacterium]|tara:strand:+ start:219 stop:1445 length:1227 start_codon:yes stop_codon:yes gene_type:complete